MKAGVRGGGLISGRRRLVMGGSTVDHAGGNEWRVDVRGGIKWRLGGVNEWKEEVGNGRVNCSPCWW